MTNHMLSTTLLARLDGRPIARTLEVIRCRTHLGFGVVRYFTVDGYVGVALDGEPNERRVEELSASDVTVLR